MITLLLLGGLVLLAVGAEGLVRGSSAIAIRLGVTPLAVGLTIVAFGTGTPELSVSVAASFSGNSAIALGNVVGSNISNIGLILGLSALARPMRVRSELLRREVPLMIAVTLLLWLLMSDGVLGRLDGLLLTAGSLAYTAFAYLAAKRDRSVIVAEEFEDALAVPKRSTWIDWLLILGGITALLAGAKLLLTGATIVAERLGVSQMVIGLTVVAIGTSLPELATSVVASLRGEPDVAFGNVLGSNILNILCILGLAALIRPFGVQELRPLDLAVLIGSALLVLPLLWRGSILNRWEGALLLAGYVTYLYSLLP